MRAYNRTQINNAIDNYLHNRKSQTVTDHVVDSLVDLLHDTDGNIFYDDIFTLRELDFINHFM